MALSLPSEIRLHILRAAADVFIHRDRKTVLDLALTSHLVYRLVAPILHYTLIVIPTNWYKVQYILRDEHSAPRVCPLVQHLIIDCDGPLNPERNVSMSFPYFTSLRRMTGHLSHDYFSAEMIFFHRWSNLTMLECWDMSTDDILTLLPRIPPTVTHFVHPAIITSDNDMAQLDSWLADNGQHLTHFGFNVMEDDMVSTLAYAAQRVLSLCPLLQQLVFHLAGTPDWMSYRVALENIDSRVLILPDQRPASCSGWTSTNGQPSLNTITDDPSVYCAFVEAQLGRTIWDLPPESVN